MPLSDLQDAKEQVRQAVDIVDLVGSYMALRRQGRGYVAVCPWHDDTRPSLQINPDRQSYKCWVCDVGGDIFSFLMRMENIEFREALEMLADRVGISLKPTSTQAGKSSEFERRNLFAVMAWAEKEFHQCLLNAPQAAEARRYLEERNFSPETLSQFNLGFAPESWDWLLSRAQRSQFSPAVMERVGLVAKRQSGQGFYDRFRGRLMFSIRDTRSRPIAFGGRILPSAANSNSDRQEAKYINSPETPLFSKSNQLYALDVAREGIAKRQNIVVMEGYTDVIMAHQFGITNAVAVLGTALGEKHIPLLRRFTDSITLVLDGDEAGQRRTMQILDELLALFVAQEIDLKILTLPEGADPCDVIVSQGRESFEQLLLTAVDALEHKIATVTKGLALAPGTHRTAQAVEEILDTLARAFPAQSNSTSATLLREQQVLSRLSRQFGVPEETVNTRLVSKRREIASKQQSRFRTQQPTPQETGQKIQISSWERELIELILHHPEAIDQLLDRIAPNHIENTFCRKIFEFCKSQFEAGESITYEKLMLQTNEPSEQNLLVECDEQGKEKSSSDTQQRIKDILTLTEKLEQESQQQSTVADLKQNQLDLEHQKELLAEFYSELKGRQAGSSPTDG